MIKLGDVISLDKTVKVDIQDNIEYTIAGVQSYGKGVLNKRKELGINMTMKQYQLIEPNQLMWCKVDTKNGAFGITKFEHKGSLASTNMCLAKIKTDKILPEFLEKLFRIKFFHEGITHLSSGTTNRKYLTPNQLCDLIYIPNFTIQEQKDFLQFVNKLESSPIFSHIDYQLTQLENLNQAILQEAVQGKLVRQDPKDEPASELLKRIKAEKMNRLGVSTRAKKEKPLPPIKPEEIPFEIPENWAWCRLGEICSKVTDGFHHTPKKYKEGNIYISATHIRENGIKWDECLFIAPEDHNELFKKAAPQKGEILITNRGAGCGTPAIIDIDEEFSFQNAALIGFNQELICNKYLFYFILKSRGEIMQTFVNGGLQPMLSNVVLSTIPFPLPPLSEQKRIVAEIEKQFAKTKQLKEHILANQIATEQLLKALLHQAFEIK